MLRGFFKRLFGDPNQRTITQLQKVVQTINALEPEFMALSDEQLRAQTQISRQRLADGETLADVLPQAFAAIREASRRTIGLRPYDVQLIGGMILHQGQVAEMRTGEGKTLVATLPLYLNALEGRGAHLVTPNDYLAKYGVQWMGPVYHALGVRVSVIQSGAGNPDEASFLYDTGYTSADDRYQYLRSITRREAYDDETCGALVRGTMEADLFDRSSIQGKLHSWLENGFSRFVLINSFLSGDSSKAEAMGITFSRTEKVAAALAAGVIGTNAAFYRVGLKVPGLSTWIDRRLNAKIARLLDTYGHADFVTDPGRYTANAPA